MYGAMDAKRDRPGCLSAAAVKRGNESDRFGCYPHPPTFLTTLYIPILYIFIYLYPSATAGNGGSEWTKRWDCMGVSPSPDVESA